MQIAKFRSPVFWTKAPSSCVVRENKFNSIDFFFALFKAFEQVSERVRANIVERYFENNHFTKKFGQRVFYNQLVIRFT